MPILRAYDAGDVDIVTFEDVDNDRDGDDDSSDIKKDPSVTQLKARTSPCSCLWLALFHRS